MFPNYPLFGALETQLTFMAVGEPDYYVTGKQVVEISWETEEEKEEKWKELVDIVSRISDQQQAKE